MPRLFATLLALLAASGLGQTSSEVRDGDIIFHTSLSTQSEAIQKATGSAYSHMGVVLFREGKPYVLEAVATVRYTPLDRWIARGKGGHYVVKRLKNTDASLTPQELSKLQAAARRFEGKAYDPTFEWSDDRVYCSELVWKLFDRSLGVQIGELRNLRDFDLSSPAVRQKLRERYGQRVPMGERVISPESMFRSKLLVTVKEN